MEAGEGLAVPLPVSITSMTVMNKKQIFEITTWKSRKRWKSSRESRRWEEQEARRAGRKAARIAIRNEEKNNG